MRTFRELESVALIDDLEQFDLRIGDVGVVLLVHGPEDYTVEFTAPGGYSCALLTMNGEWLREPSARELQRRRRLVPHEFVDVVRTRPRVKSEGS
jgi:hypothetical protein